MDEMLRPITTEDPDRAPIVIAAPGSTEFQAAAHFLFRSCSRNFMLSRCLSGFISRFRDC